jgi:hypothetical protein
MPSFSKDCFGGFVEFQWVTIVPNQKIDSSKLLSRVPCSKSQPQAPDQRAIGRATCIDASTDCIFPKAKTLPPRSRESRGRHSSADGRRSQPRAPQDLAAHACINLRLPTYSGLYAWEFEKDGRALKVGGRAAGVQQYFDDPRGGAGRDRLGVFARGQGPGASADGRLVRVLADWRPPFSGYHLHYPNRRQPAAAFALLVDALRYREAPGRGEFLKRSARSRARSIVGEHEQPASDEAMDG